MKREEFCNMVRNLYPKVSVIELQHLFKHFDVGSKGYIARHDFRTQFDSQVKKFEATINPEDILKPLATRVEKYKTSIGNLFDTYD